jgi:hypothetical protein
MAVTRAGSTASARGRRSVRANPRSEVGRRRPIPPGQIRTKRPCPGRSRQRLAFVRARTPRPCGEMTSGKGGDGRAGVYSAGATTTAQRRRNLAVGLISAEAPLLDAAHAPSSPGSPAAGTPSPARQPVRRSGRLFPAERRKRVCARRLSHFDRGVLVKACDLEMRRTVARGLTRINDRSLPTSRQAKQGM